MHVPYRGTGETISDLIAGRIQFYMNSPPPVIGFIRDGRLRAIATTGPERHPALPEVPNLRESGLTDMPINVWFALYAPARTPSAVLERLTREVQAVLAEPEVRRRAQEAGTFATFAPPAVVAERLAAETAAWFQVVKAAGIRPD